VVTFEASDVKDLEREFRASVDDYLAMCAERGEEPEKPYSGKFLVRLDPMLHREVALAAARAGKSLNAFTAEVFRRWMAYAGQPSLSRTPPAPNVNRPQNQVKIFEQTSAPVEVADSRQNGLDLWQTGTQNTPGSRTPNTPGGSRTPQRDIPNRKVA